MREDAVSNEAKTIRFKALFASGIALRVQLLGLDVDIRFVWQRLEKFAVPFWKAGGPVTANTYPNTTSCETATNPSPIPQIAVVYETASEYLLNTCDASTQKDKSIQGSV